MNRHAAVTSRVAAGLMDLSVATAAVEMSRRRRREDIFIVGTDEYTFRFNRRSSRSWGLLFYRLMEQAAKTAPLPYRQIVRRHPNI
jgi:hypothetical protein